MLHASAQSSLSIRLPALLVHLPLCRALPVHSAVLSVASGALRDFFEAKVAQQSNGSGSDLSNGNGIHHSLASAAHLSSSYHLASNGLHLHVSRGCSPLLTLSWERHSRLLAGWARRGCTCGAFSHRARHGCPARSSPSGLTAHAASGACSSTGGMLRCPTRGQRAQPGRLHPEAPGSLPALHIPPRRGGRAGRGHGRLGCGHSHSTQRCVLPHSRAAEQVS